MASDKKTPMEFAREWYTDEGIFAAVCQSSDIPQVTNTCEFAAWLTNQYRLTFAKGMQIARDETSKRPYWLEDLAERRLREIEARGSEIVRLRAELDEALTVIRAALDTGQCGYIGTNWIDRTS